MHSLVTLEDAGNHHLSSFALTKSERQFWEGGYRCSECGCEADMSGQKVQPGTRPQRSAVTQGVAILILGVIPTIALTIWIIAEVAVRRNWGALIAIPATFCIGVSCGLPLYLFLRSAPIR